MTEFHREQLSTTRDIAKMHENCYKKKRDLKSNILIMLQCKCQVEDLLVAMEKVKQELEVMKAKLSSTQLSLAEKEGHLTALRAERRKHLEEVLEMK